jgi:hypothetical protein
VAVIICFGQAGFGTWHEPEMRAALSESMQRGCPVIPVLLPGCPANLELPLFLKDRTWVDLRNGLDDDAAKAKLLWGITGQKPVGMPIGTLPGKLKPFGTRRIFIAAGVSLMLVMAILWLFLFSGVFTPKQPLAGIILDQNGYED